MSSSRRSQFKRKGVPDEFGRGNLALQRGRTARSVRTQAYRNKMSIEALARKMKTERELKFFDQDVDDASIAANGTIFTNSSAEASLIRIAAGDGESNRDGRKIVITKIKWRYQVDGTELSNTTKDTVRLILYLDTQCNGAAATVTNILETDDFQSFRNLTNSKRFKILMDRTYSFYAQAGAGNGVTDAFGSQRYDDTFYKDVNIPVEYSSTTGAIAELTQNNLGLLVMSDTGNTKLEGKMRLMFVG